MNSTHAATRLVFAQPGEEDDLVGRFCAEHAEFVEDEMLARAGECLTRVLSESAGFACEFGTYALPLRPRRPELPWSVRFALGSHVASRQSSHAPSWGCVYCMAGTSLRVGSRPAWESRVPLAATFTRYQLDLV